VEPKMRLPKNKTKNKCKKVALKALFLNEFIVKIK
jgi:hypothetical protein